MIRERYIVHVPLAYPESIEPLVRFIEDTPMAQIVNRVCERLRAGTSATDLLLASGLAVIRSSDVPAVHHGGALHPVCGMHAAHHMSRRLPGNYCLMPVVQHVAMANKHIHDLDAGPFILPEATPTSVRDNLEDTLKRLRYHVKHGEYYACEGYFLYLLEKLPPIEVFENLLNIGIAKNENDDHNVLLPVYTWRILKWAGWQFAKYFVRPAVRYVTRAPGPLESIEADDLIEEYGLDTREIPQRSGDNETPAVTALSQEIGACTAIANIPEMIARYLAEGLSLEGAGEGLSVGGSRLLLRSQSADAMGDVHVNTTANARRYLIQQPDLGVVPKLRSLLNWATGPDIRRTESHLSAMSPCTTEPSIGSGVRQQGCSLSALYELLRDLPKSDDQVRSEDGRLLCGDGVTLAVMMAQGYLDAGNDSSALLQMLGELVCRDNNSEFHLYKHHQAIWEEYHSTRASLASIHLLAAVKATAMCLRSDQLVFASATRALPYSGLTNSA